MPSFLDLVEEFRDYRRLYKVTSGRNRSGNTIATLNGNPPPSTSNYDYLKPSKGKETLYY